MRASPGDGGGGFPAEPWRIRETALRAEHAVRNETLFFLGNGHLGMRGAFEEGFPASVPGTYINGFYDETPITYGEAAFGYAKNRQVMLNVANGAVIRLAAGGEPLDLSRGEVLAYERTLDLAEGLTSRRVRWRSPAGRELSLAVRRIVCIRRPSVAAIEWSVTLERGECDLAVASLVDGAVTNLDSGDDPRIGVHFPAPPLACTRREAAGLFGLLEQRTRRTRLALACAMDHRLDHAGLAAAPTVTAREGAQSAAIVVSARCAAGSSLRLTKYLAYVTSLECPPQELASRAQAEAARAREAGFSALAEEQAEEVRRFWASSDVEIEGDEALQQGIRFNLFSLLQSAGRDGRTSIAAKGLSGEGYEGHYFWDCEIYVLPFFTYTQPGIARALLGYRAGILDKARARAAQLSQRGALYPWRTIGGEETSPYYPAGTAQYHIDADIAYALGRYLDATGDDSPLLEGGAEMLFETARLWADLGTWNPRRGHTFCINEVTGPDEYTALVNNNLYTNLMARENLELAVRVAERMRQEHPRALDGIMASIGLQDAEIDGWRRAAAGMYVPFDGELGIHEQDDAFLDRRRWDIPGTPPGRFPLLLHYHPLVIYRHQVLKQPDVVLAQVLLGNRFTRAEKKRNFDYYDPITTGDSSLSPCIQSIAAAELGYGELAYRYFTRTARMDLDDVHGNVENGVHTAAMAGAWLAIIHGFAGMRDRGGVLSFSPRLPAAWQRLRFRLRTRGRLLEVDLARAEATYRLVEGEALTIYHRCREVRLTSASPCVLGCGPNLAAVVVDLEEADDGGLRALGPACRGLRERGFRIAIMSTRRTRAELVASTADLGAVDFVRGCDGLLKGPPDPEAFFGAAEELGVPPEDCAAVADHPDAIQAACAAGMFGVSPRGLTPESLPRLFASWASGALPESITRRSP